MTKHIIVYILLHITMCLMAQNTIKGRVTDNETGEALTGAYVIWQGTSRGAITDQNGNYILNRVESTTKVTVSYTGYEDTTVETEGQSDIDIALKAAVLEEVEVAARRTGASLNRMSATVTQDINTAELYKAACCTLGESFETNASVDVNYADAATGAKTIQMLGLSGRYVQMMIENVPNLRGLASAFGLSYVPGPWMDGIQVSKGVGTVVNGYEAITGQINIEYKKPTSADWGAVNIFGSSNGRAEANIEARTPVGNNASTAILVNMAKDMMVMDENKDTFRDEPTTRQLSLLNRWNYHNNRGYNLHLTFKTLNEERTSGHVDYNQKTPSREIYGVYIKTDRAETWMKNAFVFNEQNNMGIATGYIYHYQKSYYGKKSYTATQHSYNINVIYNHTSDNEMHEIHAGASSQGDYIDETLHMNQELDYTLQTGPEYSLGNIYTVQMKADRPSTSLTNVTAGIFGQYTLKLDTRLTMIVGGRLDYGENHGGIFATPRLHIRYAPTENTTIRAAIGKGYRIAATMVENNNMLNNSRDWDIEQAYGEETAWNMGVNITRYIEIADRQMTLSAEYYRTTFGKQLIIDLDKDVQKVYAHFTTKRSFANNVQIEGRYEIARNLELTGAWRWNTAKQHTGGKLQQRPLVSRYKGLVTLSYMTPLKTWQFDVNAQFSGGGRVPSTAMNPEEYQRPDHFHPYQTYNGQITKWFRTWSIYAGCENIGNFRQKNPIIEAENPYGTYFDASLIWGPLMTRKYYVGLRWNLEKN